MADLFLHPAQVRDMIKTAEQEHEVIIIWCIRKGKASKVGGPDQGDLYDLHCTTKPAYEKKTDRDRTAEDADNGVLTVFVTNRQDKDGNWGTWRRVNIDQVKRVGYKGKVYTVQEI